MKPIEEIEDEPTYPVRVVARMTGLKPELIRAWESRYGAVHPIRTPGGSRRYSASDLRRLRLLREAVDAGHRIGQVARLSAAELRRLVPEPATVSDDPIAATLEAVKRLDALELRRLLTSELERLGTEAFATDLALPLLVEVGARWERGELSISAEHLATAVVRSLLMPTLDPDEERGGGPKIVFATPSGELHDVGTLVAAMLAGRVGAEVIYLGADVPAEDLARTAIDSRAAAVALGVVTLPADSAMAILRDLRDRVPQDVGVWIGGAGIERVDSLPGIVRIANFDQLEANVTLLDGGVADETPALAEQRGTGDDSGGAI